MTQSELSEFLSDAPALYEFKSAGVGEYRYKIWDDNVGPRHFLGADHEDGIEAILLEREEVLDTIEPKLTRKEIGDLLYHTFIKTCHEVFPEWNHKTLTIASSSDAKKMSLHISTTGMRLPNIARVAIFTELVRKKLPMALQANSIIDNIANKSSFSLKMLGSPKYNEKTGEHVRMKKAIHPKDGSVFDFMIRPPNDESEVVKSSLLDILEPKVQRFDDTNSETTEAEFELVEGLLQEANIEGYSLSYPSENFPDRFPLSRLSPSHCPISNQNRQPGSRKPSKKLTIGETALDREKKLPIPEKQGRPRISDSNDHFVWWDLISMCTSKKKFTRNEVYNTIQATIACVQKKSKTWILKHKKSDGGLYFDMGFKLDIGKLTINIIELGGEAIKLQSLIENAFNTGLIAYADIDFLPYPPNTISPKTEFFNFFLRFKAKPASHINYNLVNPIIWHIEYIWCNGDKNLSEYVLKCLFGPELVYSTSDLGKILGKFNSAIQGRKLIIINEAGMASGEWHKANDHLKFLITEDYVSIERKGLEFQECGHYPGFMILSNHDTPIRVKMGDRRIVCLDVSPRCKRWKPRKIPPTKMKVETMRNQLSNPIRFIIDHIASWAESSGIRTSSKAFLYQKYLEWCGDNGEKVLPNNIFGKKLSEKNIIEYKQVRVEGEKREWQYILNHSKIIVKLREYGLGDIEEFSDISQVRLPAETRGFRRDGVCETAET
ncbi:hypothetical protein RhiirA4_486677, partial [Rhizophagus irregularis]